MLEIENRFQPVADAILSGALEHITPFEAPIVAYMHALWLVRYIWQTGGGPDPVMKMVRPERELTKVHQEALERAGVLFARPDATVPMRQLIGVRMHLQVDDVAEKQCKAAWGIFRADDGEFLVPDNFAPRPILPLSPNTLLVCGVDDARIGRDAVVNFNQLALACAGRYVFARNWTASPILPSSSDILPLERSRFIR